MIAETTPLSHHVAALLADLVGLEPSWPFQAVGMLAVATLVLMAVVTPVGLGGVYLERKLATGH